MRSLFALILLFSGSFLGNLCMAQENDEIPDNLVVNVSEEPTEEAIDSIKLPIRDLIL